MSQLLTLDTTKHRSGVLDAFLAGRNAFGRAGVAVPQRQVMAATSASIGSTFAGQPSVDMLGVVPSNSGVRVTELSAKRVSTVYACVGLIAGAISSMPKNVYERKWPDASVVDHEFWWYFNERPCAEVSAAVMWEYLADSLLLQGDAFAEIIRPNVGSNRVLGFRPHAPQRVWVRRTPEHQLYYVVQPIDGTAAYVVDAADMIHVPGLGFDGWRGMSVVRFAAREAIGLGLATEEFSARFFSNGARPDFVFKTEKSLKKQDRDDLLESWQGQYGGVGKSHMPAILTGGLAIEKISMSPEDAALLDARGFQVEDLCRFFGVPPFMVGHTSTSTAWGSGLEAMGSSFVRYTLQRHLTKFEQEFNAKLWPTRARFFMGFDTDGLERGNMEARFGGYRQALGRAGEQPWMTINEIRRKEQLTPIDGGNELPDVTVEEPAGGAGQTGAQGA